MFDERLEHVTVDGAVHNRRAAHPRNAQRGDQRRGSPMAVRRLVDQSLTARRPASQSSHIGLGPGLIDEDQTIGADPRLDSLPRRAAARYVGAILLRRVERLFLKDNPSRLSAMKTADSTQSTFRRACNSLIVASGR